MDVQRYFEYIKKYHPGTPLFVREEWRMLTYPYVMQNRYKVSSYGQIYDTYAGCMVNQINAHDYRKVYLKDQNNQTVTCYMHTLIAWQFVPNTSGGTVINHIDGNRSNNIYTNLEWTTQSGNCMHAAFIRLSRVGVEKTEVYVTEEDIHFVCKSLAEAAKYPDIIDELIRRHPEYDREKMRGFISNIQQGRTFKEIAAQYNIDNKYRNATMSKEDIVKMAKMLEAGTSVDELAKEFNVDDKDRRKFKSHIGQIVRGEYYGSITKDYNMRYPEGMRINHTNFSKETSRQIAEWVRDGKSNEEILVSLFGADYRSVLSESDIDKKMNALNHIRKHRMIRLLGEDYKG